MSDLSEWRVIPGYEKYECKLDRSDGVRVRSRRRPAPKRMGIIQHGSIGGGLIALSQGRYNLRKTSGLRRAMLPDVVWSMAYSDGE